VTVSHNDPGTEVLAVPGCKVNLGVQLHSDLLLIDPQVCEDHMVSSNTSGGQNVGRSYLIFRLCRQCMHC